MSFGLQEVLKVAHVWFIDHKWSKQLDALSWLRACMVEALKSVKEGPQALGKASKPGHPTTRSGKDSGPQPDPKSGALLSCLASHSMSSQQHIPDIQSNLRKEETENGQDFAPPLLEALRQGLRIGSTTCLRRAVSLTVQHVSNITDVRHVTFGRQEKEITLAKRGGGSQTLLNIST